MHPSEGAAPRMLSREPVRLSALAKRYGLTLRGPDRDISTMNYLDAPAAGRGRQLTYATTARYVHAFIGSGIAACLTRLDLAPATPPDVSLLLVDGDPIDAFYTILADSAREGHWEMLAPGRGRDCEIADTAVIHDHVVIGDECRIMAGAVLLPNTRLGRGVVIKPNAVVGGDGFEIKVIGRRRRIVPHVGGVWLEDDVEVGSNTCVDRGLFGEFTWIGSGSKIDNLVHIAHRVAIGSECSVIACAEVSGSAVLGRNVWVGPNASINQGLSLGDHAFIGTGAVVTRPVPAYALAYGSPARVNGWLCHCRGALVFADGHSVCPSCGAAYRLENGQVTPAPAA